VLPAPEGGRHIGSHRVIDNDSTDATFDIASKAGAEVFRSGEIHPELGAFRGKGEALWKSLLY